VSQPKHVVVREYARLTCSTLAQQSLDRAQISETAFDWLCQLASSFTSAGAKLLQLDDRKWLRLDNYVGVLESPCGQIIEVLPKIHDTEDCEFKSRQLLCKLIAEAMELPTRQAENASLALKHNSLSEWVIAQFLTELDYLLKRGLRFDYLRVEEEQRYLSGQLNVVQQLRQPPGRQHHFQIRHDIFVPNRAENRLLMSALQLVCKSTQEAENWRLAHELRCQLLELPASSDIGADFKAWRDDRLMAHYQAIKPWLELILYQRMPLATSGNYRGISLLFPMERLFEVTVAKALKKAAVAATGSSKAIKTQCRTEFLCSHQQQDWFQLKPDLSAEFDGRQWIMDTKWKRLDLKDSSAKFGLSQQDFYQMFAYGHKYLAGSGTLVLIYPAWQGFPANTKQLHFSYSAELSLYVLPYNLEDENAAKTLISWLQQGNKQHNAAFY
jgi:5-methylcytosine-specific restriction enzyme subunit McrC